MPQNRLSRREKEKNNHKKAIFEVALQLFSRKGFHNVSIQEIAEKSEFGIGTIYSFFESKEVLFEELKKDAADNIMREVSKILEGPGDEKSRLVKFISHWPVIQEQYGDLIRLYVSELRSMGATLSVAKSENKFQNELNSKLSKLVENGIHKGLFRKVDPVITVRALNAILEILIFETTTDPFNRNIAAGMCKKVEQLFIGGLLIP